ncbi:MAG TPA: polysaccharide deacetylase family protein, partial [Chloroflexota bacterium]
MLARLGLALLTLALVSVTVTPGYAQSDDASPPACPVSDDAPTPAPTPPIPPRVDGPSGVVALTFDAGADRGYAEAILDTLKTEGVPASFGMTGQWAQANPDLVQRMVAEGHRLINHTWEHRSWTGLSDQRGH